MQSFAKQTHLTPTGIRQSPRLVSVRVGRCRRRVADITISLLLASTVLSQACMRGGTLLATAANRSAALDAVAASQGAAGGATAFQRAARPPAPPASLARSFERSSVEVGVDATPESTRLPDGRRIEDAGDGVSVWWSLERLQAYLAHAKTIQPMLTPSAQTVLKRYYALQRRADTRSAARTTVRLLDSLVRITQAHARLLRRQTAGLQDAVIAVILMETSTHAAAVIGVLSPLHATFPDDPDAEYAAQQRLVLHRLGLDGLADEGGEDSAAHQERGVTTAQLGAGFDGEEEEAAMALAPSSASQIPTGPARPLERVRQAPDASLVSPGTIAPFHVDLMAARALLNGSFPDVPIVPPHRRGTGAPSAVASPLPSASATIPGARSRTSASPTATPVAARAPPLVGAKAPVSAAPWLATSDSFRPPSFQPLAPLPPPSPRYDAPAAPEQVGANPPAHRGSDWFNNPGPRGAPGGAAAFNAHSVLLPRQRGMIHEPSASISLSVPGVEQRRGAFAPPPPESPVDMPPPPPPPARSRTFGPATGPPRLIHSIAPQASMHPGSAELMNIPLAEPLSAASAAQARLQPSYVVDGHDLLELSQSAGMQPSSLAVISRAGATQPAQSAPSLLHQLAGSKRSPAEAALGENQPHVHSARNPNLRAGAGGARARFGSNPCGGMATSSAALAGLDSQTRHPHADLPMPLMPSSAAIPSLFLGAALQTSVLPPLIHAACGGAGSGGVAELELD